MELIVQSTVRTQSHHEREYEQSHRVPDHIVSQQNRGDNSGRHLSACDLNCHQQRAKRKHDE